MRREKSYTESRRMAKGVGRMFHERSGTQADLHSETLLVSEGKEKEKERRERSDRPGLPDLPKKEESIL